MEKYKKIAYISVSTVAILLLSYVFLKYALSIILPFAFSFLIVALARPMINKMCKNRKIPKQFASILVISILLFITVYLTTVCVSYGIKQLGFITNSILDNLSNENNFISNAFDKVESLKNKFPFLNSILPGFDESVYSMLLDTVANTLKTLSTKLTSFMASFISSLPSFIIMLIVIILSLFYFSKDYDLIAEKIEKSFPENIASKLPTVKREAMSMVLKYIKAYSLLMLISFALLLSGFLILGIKNSFLLAIIISFVDMLPILGVGTALIPWSIVALLQGNTFLGIGLLILFLIVYIVRQIAEPKLLSKQMNIHPLITIFSMYAGLKILGIGGLIIAPFIAFLIKSVFNSLKKEKNVENRKKL